MALYEAACRPVCSQQVDLIDDQQGHLLHVRPVLPAAADAVPLLRRADDDVGSQQRAHVGRVVTCDMSGAAVCQADQQGIRQALG